MVVGESLAREMHVLADCLFHTATYDQLDGGCLEVVSRRLQAIVDADGVSAAKPKWSIAKYYSGSASSLNVPPPGHRRRSIQDDYDDDAINQGRPPHRFDTRRRRTFEMRRRRTVDAMTRGGKQENIWGRPPWRPRFNDRKACSSISTEQECGRNRPRCWWQPYLEECYTSYIHGSMTRGVTEWPPGDPKYWVCPAGAIRGCCRALAGVLRRCSGSAEGLRRYATRSAKDGIDLQLALAQVRDMRFGGGRASVAQDDYYEEEAPVPWGRSAPKPKALSRPSQIARQRQNDKGAAGHGG